MDTVEIPGYRYGDPTLPVSPLTLADLERIQRCLLFSAEDAAALRRAREILEPQVDAILDVWYGFVGSQDFLLDYFSTDTGPDSDYLARVRQRFGRWILDTCRAEYDQKWLDYQAEIGRRHIDQKNATDDVQGAPALIHFRYVNALIYPIYATIRPFLERGEADPAKVEQMHQSWLKSVLLQVTLWSQPYLRDGAF